MTSSPVIAWSIIAASTAGVILRPFSWPEYIWAMGGAILLVLFGLLPLSDALKGIAKGSDVYLFLSGMMLLAEIARKEGLFDWLAAQAARRAAGSEARLFTLIFIVGTIVTAFLSNDATAVVLTPAVAVAAKKANVKEPLPYLFICAFIANAASFILPISNPANLVIYGNHMPPLLQWLPRYALPSIFSVVATYIVLRWTQRKLVQGRFSAEIEIVELSAGGKMAAIGLAGTVLALLASSAFGIQLGLPTFIAAIATAIIVLLRSQDSSPLSVIRDISWGVLPLVAGLFIFVEALNKMGAIADWAAELERLVGQSASLAAWASGLGLAFGCDLVNNLSAGLVAGQAVQMVKVPESVRAAVLIGVDLGPNLSVTGSLATILWLTALKREGYKLSAWDFLKLGAVVMPPALLLALLSAMLLAPI